MEPSTSSLVIHDVIKRHLIRSMGRFDAIYHYLVVSRAINFHLIVFRVHSRGIWIDALPQVVRSRLFSIILLFIVQHRLLLALLSIRLVLPLIATLPTYVGGWCSGYTSHPPWPGPAAVATSLPSPLCSPCRHSP
ncbi:hypothetical protein PG993_003600 [Apiospora rasikravindrae]|uniref:Uncharacterized protein n=1 Tax=Apiospora rasikravindrae TaxID=990691 RepID=A0ABR1TZY9_9PEZI